MFLGGAGFFLKLAIAPVGREFALSIAFIALVPGMALLLQAWRSRLILDGDTIEVHSALRVRRARRDEIEGLRVMRNQYGNWTRVYLKDNQGAFNISDSFTGDADLRKWLKGLPDLDRRDADEVAKEQHDNDAIGLPASHNSNRVAAAKQWGMGLSILAGIASIPVIFVSYFPVYSAALIVLLALPPLGIVLIHRSPLRFTLFKRKPDPRADLGFLILWPGIAMLFSYQTSNDPSHQVNWLQLIYWVLLASTAFIGGLFQTAWKNPARAGALFGVIFFGFMYSIGLVNTINTLPDRSAPTRYKTWTVGMHVSHSSKGSRYYLRVAPWGPIPYRDDVDVPSSTYEAFHVGDPICFGLHPGFLHSAWYTLVPCPAQRIFIYPS